METFFSNILVPIDFSVNSEVAIQKAKWLAVPGFTTIHLLHVQKPLFKPKAYYTNGLLMPVVESFIYTVDDVKMKLQQMREAIEASLNNVEVVAHLLYEQNIHRGIRSLAKELRPSLIIIGERESRKCFPYFKKVNAGILSKETSCALLIAKPGSIPNRMKSIVMPVRSFVPKRKIELLLALTRYHRPVIHLVTICDDKKFNGKASVFLETYRTISDYYHYPVEYRAFRGTNLAKTIFDYAKNIQADFIIANPIEETKINNFFRTDISDLIEPKSPLSILMTEPFRN